MSAATKYTLENNKIFNELYNKKPVKYDDIRNIKFITDVEAINSYETKDNNKENYNNMFKNVAVIKLNGGLGTTMKLNGPKSLLTVKDNLTFLDITIKQNENNKLILMNSPHTDIQTKKYIKNNNITCNISHLLQHNINKIDSKTKNKVDDIFNPPGHGDIFYLFKYSHILQKLLKEGYKYLFISNIDNLGATLDINIYNYIKNNNIPFLMEVANKLPDEWKCGSLIKVNDKIKLLEVGQINKEQIETFKQSTLINTNNIWINIETLINKLETNTLELDLIYNYKGEFIQLETAMGSAIQSFENAKLLKVERNRFIPVKTLEDLEKIRSSEYYLNDEFKLLHKG